MKVKLLSITPNVEKLIEEAGRTAYLSGDKTNEGSEKKFIKRIVKMGHESVLEHASATFRIEGGSRAFTHQEVRHRLCSFTQQSQRYVNEIANMLFNTFLGYAKIVYKLLQSLGIKNEDARFVLPNAIESEIVVTANLRQWRHVIGLRGEKHAQWEIRAIIIEILKILKKEAPTVFEDFIIVGDVIKRSN